MGTRLQCTLRIQTEQAATFLSGLTSIQTKLYLIYATQNFSSMFGVVNGKQKKKKEEEFSFGASLEIKSPKN